MYVDILRRGRNSFQFPTDIALFESSTRVRGEEEEEEDDDDGSRTHTKKQ